jgi:NitT/TauT family transport system ATP-binding protein
MEREKAEVEERDGTEARAADAVSFERVSKSFWGQRGAIRAVERITLSVQRGEFIGIVGPSGCGKSTLLNMASGLMRPTQGQVFYEGRPVEGINTRVGYMAQKDNLLPWRDAESNVAVALEMNGIRGRERRETVAKYIELVGLEGFEKHYPSQLSGGMRKRVSLARALAYDPDTLLMDEPFGALDAQLRLILQEELMRIWQATKKTILFVTHDLEEAVTLSNRVVMFTSRPGTIRAIKDVPIPRPRDVFRARFTDEFKQIYSELWEELKKDIRKGEDSL